MRLFRSRVTMSSVLDQVTSLPRSRHRPQASLILGMASAGSQQRPGRVAVLKARGSLGLVEAQVPEPARCPADTRCPSRRLRPAPRPGGARRGSTRHPARGRRSPARPPFFRLFQQGGRACGGQDRHVRLDLPGEKPGGSLAPLQPPGCPRRIEWCAARPVYGLIDVRDKITPSLVPQPSHRVHPMGHRVPPGSVQPALRSAVRFRNKPTGTRDCVRRLTFRAVGAHRRAQRCPRRFRRQSAGVDTLEAIHVPLYREAVRGLPAAAGQAANSASSLTTASSVWLKATVS